MARTIRWEGLEAFVRPGLGFKVVEHSTGWHVYLCGDPLDRVDHPDEAAAKTAAEAVVDELDAALPWPKPTGARPRRPEEYPGRPPHPGKYRQPPR